MTQELEYPIQDILARLPPLMTARSRDPDTGDPILVKFAASGEREAEALELLERERALLQDLSVSGLVRPQKLVASNGRHFLVYADPGGAPLKRLIPVSAWDLSAFLDIAVKLAGIVLRLHAEKILVNGICPQNVLLKETGRQVFLIGLCRVARVAGNRFERGGPETVPDLAYASPEHTGRVPHAVDFRSDLYSLGVVLYEMLAKCRPFTEKNPQALMHAHLARPPVPLSEKAPGVPAIVSGIVGKLLAKSPEDRYQSARGLYADLARCLRAVEEKRSLPAFSLGREDVVGRLVFPERLYGRRGKIRDLKKDIADAAAGRKSIRLVAGTAGVGKTSLVRQVADEAGGKGAVVISGKFQQFGQNQPYAAAVEAFRSLIRGLLTQSDDALSDLRSRMQEALGGNARVVAELIPEIRLVLGPQPAAPPLPLEETRNRFTLASKNLVSMFCNPGKPLVLFLDDLQWGDASTFGWVEDLLSDPEIKNLLVVGAFRDDSLSSTHPLFRTMDSLLASGVSVRQMLLPPLSLGETREFLEGVLRMDSGEVGPLVDLLFSKTSGNPLFLRQVLSSLHEDGRLVFDGDRGAWKWDMEAVEALDEADNLLALMSGKIRYLPEKTAWALSRAACVGAVFELSFLARVCNEGEPLMERLLLPALRHGFLEETDPDPGRLARGFRFSHDRVQQAAYALLEADEASSVHHRIGRVLLERAWGGEPGEGLFETVNQLNRGRSVLEDDEERLELARLNLSAARKAMGKAAFSSALDYLETGLGLLPENPWEDHYGLALDLHTAAAEAACLGGSFNRMEEFCREVADKAASLMDSFKAYEVAFLSLVSRDQLEEAVDAGLALLKMLGVKLPAHPSLPRVALTGFRTERIVSRFSGEALRNLPEMEDPKKRAAMRVLSMLILVMAQVRPLLVPLAAFAGITLSIRHGKAPETPVFLALFSFYLCAYRHKFDEGYRLGQADVALMDDMKNPSGMANAAILVRACVFQWKDPIRNSLPSAMEAFRQSLDSGYFEHAAMAALTWSYMAFFSGRRLEELHGVVEKLERAAGKVRRHSMAHSVRIHRRTAENLMGLNSDLLSLGGENDDEEVMRAEIQESGDVIAQSVYAFYKMYLAFLFGHPERAAVFAREGEKAASGLKGVQPEVQFAFYQCLILLDRLTPGMRQGRRRILRKVARYRKRLALWARNAPMNHRHKLFLVDAERCRVLGDEARAMDFYEQAANGAGAQGFIQEKALALELAGRFFLSTGRVEVGRMFLTQSRAAYSQWGARAKVAHLDDLYGPVLTRPREGAIPPRETEPPEGEDAAQTSALPGDSASLVRAAQIASGEIDLDRLVEHLMQIMVESAGAGRGCLALTLGERLMVYADCSQEDGHMVLGTPREIEAGDRAPFSVLKFVERTREPLLLEDAMEDPMFFRDPYVAANRPRSVLCVPIIYKGSLSGILYLENRLLRGVFGETRAETVQAVCSQLANSLENAKLFRSLENKNLQITSMNQELVREVEERKRAQDKLSESEKRYRQLVESAEDAILMVAEGTVVFYNQKAPAVFGMEDRDLKGRAFVRLIHSGDRENVESIHNGLMERGAGARQYLARLEDETGGEAWVGVQATAAHWEGSRAVLVIARDITRLRAWQERVQQVHKMEALGTLARGVAHDFNNLLSAIMGNTQVALREMGEEAGESHHLRESLEATRRAAELTRQIALFGRLGNPRPERVPMRRPVSEALRLLHASRPENVVMDMRLDDDVRVLADPGQLRQIVVNLGANAFRAMQKSGGTLTVTLTRTEVGGEFPSPDPSLAPGEYAVFTMEDTGSGISAEVLPRIFDPYFTTGRPGESSGLGLSLVHGITTSHLGSVTVKSQPGKGASFSVYLPAAEGGADRDDGDQAEIEGRVLFVDDEALIGEMARKSLMALGCDPRVFQDPAEALEAFRQAPDAFDLVITDQTMPGITGDRLAREILAIRPGFPVILCTGHSDLVDAEKAKKEGIAAFLKKPLEMEVLKKAIHEVLAREEEKAN